ncbi:MAG: helix-turn-helix domain-containing protein [Clostridia bacterium]|nr:helix-turn-helix domain-containing protein [Clostridia bacterium]
MINLDMSCIYTERFYEKQFNVWTADRLSREPIQITKEKRPFSSFIYVTDGEFNITQKNRPPIVAKPTDIVYIPANSEYTFYWSGDYCRHCTIGFVLCDSTEKELKFSDNIRLICHDCGDFYKALFAEMLTIHSTPTSGSEFRARIKFLELLNIMMNDNIKAKYHTIVKGITYLENNYLENTSISELAKMCNVSLSGFRQLFKEYCGHSPIRYRNILRIKKAAELLMYGEHNVQQAATAVNIPDVY